jgi:hypothetical protein
MVDKNVQDRAGQNVGNEPSLLNFVEKAGSLAVQLATNGSRTTIIEGIEDTIRSMIIQGGASGRLFNVGPDAVDVTLFFEDGEGHEINAGTLNIAAGANAALTNFVMPSLAAGEKISAEVAVYGGGTAAVYAVPAFHDLKRKRGGGGGLSDGNVVSIREDLAVNSVEFGPPKGKCWQMICDASRGAVLDDLPGVPGAYVNFGTNTPDVNEALVLPDGTAIAVTTETGVAATTIASDALQSWGADGFILSYPMKVRLSLTEASNVRFYAALAFAEFDLPKDVATS